MMASTYSALKSHGISSKALIRAAKFNFEPKVANYSGLPDQSSKRFWSELLACRLAFKRKTGFDIENLIGD